MKFDLVNLTKVETKNNLYQRSFMWCNQNDLNDQGFLFDNLEMQHTTELGVEESETTLNCNKYWKKSCYYNMQISSSYRFWDMEGPWSSCHSGYGKCIFVWAYSCQCAVWNNWLAFFKKHFLRTVTNSPIYVAQISVFAKFSFSNIDHGLVCFHVEYPVAKTIEIIDNSYSKFHRSR